MSNKLHVLYTDGGDSRQLGSILAQLPQPRPGARIAIKPNLVVARPSSSGATTDPALAEAIIIYLRNNGHTDISIMEGSAVGNRTAQAYATCGYTAIAKKYGVPLIDLKQDKTVPMSAAGLEIAVCQQALAVDFLINVPVLKAHCQTKITCALKNLKGCISDREKRRFHQLGLHRPIAVLGKVLKTHWTIVDGIIGDLTFEEGGTPVHMGRIIIGQDPVLIDAYVAELLGYNQTEIPYIGLAAQLGVGVADTEKGQIIEHLYGERPPVIAQPANAIANRYKQHIDERDACSACYGSLMHALNRYEERFGSLPKGLRFAIGQGFDKGESTGKGPQEVDGNWLGIGRCTASYCPKHVPGCPPTAQAILNTLTEEASTPGGNR